MRRNREEAVWEDYGEWICRSYLNISDYEVWEELLMCLHNIDFYYCDDIEKDNNRARDGLYLRNYFIEDIRGREVSKEVLENECSVLEMLAALSVRLETEYIGGHEKGDADEIDDGDYTIFFDMLENLELLDYSNDVIENSDFYEIEEIVDNWLSRSYDKYGNGGIFPISHPRRDQRDLETWEQALEYIRENY